MASPLVYIDIVVIGHVSFGFQYCIIKIVLIRIIKVSFCGSWAQHPLRGTWTYAVRTHSPAVCTLEKVKHTHGGNSATKLQSGTGSKRLKRKPQFHYIWKHATKLRLCPFASKHKRGREPLRGQSKIPVPLDLETCSQTTPLPIHIQSTATLAALKARYVP